jgi:hypothetical protein
VDVRSLVIAIAVMLGAGAELARAQGQPPAPPAPAPTREQRLADLMKKLGDPSFDVREEAQRQLEAFGPGALPALDEASKNQDPEIASRATEAASRIRAATPGQSATPGAPGTRQRPEEVEPQEAPVLPGFPGGGSQDMDEMLRDLEKQLDQQLPDGMGKLFREMLRGRTPGQPDPGPGGEQQPGVRVWTWRSGQPQPEVETSPLAPLGILTGPATPALRAQLGIAEDEGVVVERVLPGSWAQQNGIERFDVLVGVDGRSVRTTRDLQPLLEKATTVELYRRAALQKKELPAPGTRAPGPAPAPPGGQREQRSF